MIAFIGKEGDELNAIIKDSTIYGESPVHDCPYEDYCNLKYYLNDDDDDGDNEDDLEEEIWTSNCFDKVGTVTPMATNGGKDVLITGASGYPYHKIGGDSSWGLKGYYENVDFVNFADVNTYCGGQQRTIEISSSGSDIVPWTEFRYTRFTDVENEAVAYIMDPPSGWANTADCGSFPCTAPENILITFEGTTYRGETPIETKSDF
jgi:hypothetical protein